MRAVAGRLIDTWRQAPWWAQVGIVWGVSRVWVLVLTLFIYPYQDSCPFTNPVQPGFLGFITNWDSTWYQKIHDAGYPLTLPRDAGGAVQQNPWAFLPVYPAVVRVVTSIPGVSWQIAAPTVALIASLALAVMIYRLFRTKADHSTSLAAVAFVVFAPAAPVLQYGYAESLALFFVAVVLYLVVKQRYLAAIPFVLLADLTRPVGAPLALMCLIVAGVMGYRRLRRDASIAPSSLVGLGALSVVAVAGAGLWPAVAAVVTGVPDAYFLTEGAWQIDGSQLQHNVFLMSMTALYGPVLGWVVAATLVGLLGAFMLLSSVRRIGIVMWAWTGSWLGYQLLMNGLARADLRLLLTAFPLALVAAQVIGRQWGRVLVVVVFAVLQIGWIWIGWRCVGPGAVQMTP